MCVITKFKMKYFVMVIIWLLLETPMYMTHTESVFIVIKNYCITNSRSAIAFNPSSGKIKRENTLSKFYPNQQNKYFCSIEHGEKCTESFDGHYWKVINSTEGEINVEVLDRRWEEFRTYKSEYLEDDFDTLSYKIVDVPITKFNFVIPFSVRLKNEGHIFLCESDIFNSKCYWIMLQAFHGNSSAIRKCDAHKIPQKKETWPEEPCKTLLTSFNHTEYIISDSFWAHFKIIFDGSTIAVHRNDIQSSLMQFKDDARFSPKRIFIHSKIHTGLWKFHKYTYTRTQKTGLSQLLKFNKKNKCIAFFIVMCNNCILEIQMIGSSSGQLYFEKSYTTQDEKWKEIKFDFESNVENLVMHITTKLLNSRNHVNKPYWAIDSIRHCEDNEYRVLTTSTDGTPCQLIENKNSILTTQIDEISDQNTNCSDDTFGKKCIPCAAIGGTFCSSLKYCELFNNKRSCHCTSGYRNNFCNATCPWNYYGHGCKKQCDSCLYGCNNINGHCYDYSKCDEGFKGTKCDEPVAPLLKHAPEVIKINETSYIVYISNYEVIGDRDSINYIRIQYKRNMSTDWISYPARHFLPIQNINEYIDNLETDTTYCVRAQLCSHPFNIYEGSAIKERCFNTTRTSAIVYDVITNWTDNSDLNISWKFPEASNGKVIEFVINIKDDKGQIFLKKSNNCILTCFYLIEKKYFEPCRKFIVDVTAEEFITTLLSTEKWSPPPIPHISEDDIKISHITNIIVIYVPKPTDLKQDLKGCRTKLHILGSLWQNNDQVDKNINDFEHALKHSLELPTFYNVWRLHEINQEDLPFEFPMTDDGVTKYRMHLFFVNECFGNVQIRKVWKDLLPGKPMPLKDNNPACISTSWYVFFILALVLPLTAYLFLFGMFCKYEMEDILLERRKQPNTVEEIPMNDIGEPQPSTSTAHPRY